MCVRMNSVMCLVHGIDATVGKCSAFAAGSSPSVRATIPQAACLVCASIEHQLCSLVVITGVQHG